MPVKTFEEVVASLSGDEKALFEKTLKANPELKDGWLRQDDFSRKQAELAKEREKMQGDLDYAEKMKDWSERSVPIWNNLAEKGIVDKETGEELWTAKQAEFERQLAEARAAAVGGEDMDPEKLKANVQAIVKEYGALSPAETKALIAEESRKLTAETFDTKYAEKEKSFNQDTIPFVAGFSAAVAVIANKYEKETGKDWTADDAKRLYATMTETNNFDPYAVQEKFLAPHKQEKEKAADTEAEIQRRVDAEVAKRVPRRASDGLPGSGDETFIPQSEQKGNVSKMLERDGGPTDFESLINAQSVKAAKELAAAGK